MKTLLLAAVVALLCVQALHANPTPGGVSDHSESQYEISYPGESTGGDSGTVIRKTTTTQDGKTTITETNVESTKEYKIEDFGDLAGGGDYKWSESSGSTSASAGSTSASAGSTSGSGAASSDASSSSDFGWTIGGDDKCDGTDGPCDKEHKPYTFVVTEEDKEFFSDLIDEQSTSTSIRHLHDSDCEKQLEKLNDDNDHLTAQLISANEAIETLTEDKSWFLKQLEKCRDEYKCQGEDFETLMSQNRMIQKKIEKLASEYGQLKNSYMAVTAENQKYKITVQQLEGELKKSKDINIQLNVTIKQQTTIINTLNISVNELTTKNNNCGSKSEEWRLKFEFASTQVTKYELTIQNLEISIADWKSKTDKLTEEKESCRHENTANDKEIDSLKTELNETKSKLSKCNADLATCDASLTSITSEFNEDELRDHDELLYREKLQIKFDECETRRDQLQSGYNTEMENLAVCKSEIVRIREENTKNMKKCEEDITNIKITYQTTIDACEVKLQSEKDKYSQVVIQVTNLTNEITLIQHELNITIKVSEELQQKHQFCEDSSKALKEKITKLEGNIGDLGGQLSTCIGHSETTQSELSKCTSDLNTCSDDLTDNKKKNTENEALIVTQQSDIEVLKAARDGCKSDLNALRCDTNHLLAVVDDAETKSLQALFDIKGIIENAKVKVDKFVETQNIKCETCSANTPCLVNP